MRKMAARSECREQKATVFHVVPRSCTYKFTYDPGCPRTSTLEPYYFPRKKHKGVIIFRKSFPKVKTLHLGTIKRIQFPFSGIQLTRELLSSCPFVETMEKSGRSFLFFFFFCFFHSFSFHVFVITGNDTKESNGKVGKLNSDEINLKIIGLLFKQR